MSGTDAVGWLTVAGVAANGAVEVWHHGSLFRRPRARMAASDSFLGRLLSCPFCLSVWVGAACVLGVVAPLAADLGWGLRLPVLGLAAARTAQLLNDYTKAATRPPADLLVGTAGRD
jgi:hypothetical protein